MDVFIQIDASKYSSELTEEQKSFLDLTLLQKYDAVLGVLYSESGKAPTFDDINKVLLTEKKKVHWGEVMDVLYTMIGDNYLYGHFTNQKKEQIFLLSFNGKLLKEGGGISTKLQREKDKEELDIKLKGISIGNIKFTRILAYASFILALTLGAVQINKFVNERNKQEQPSITPTQVEQLLQSQRETAEHLRLLRQAKLLTDTSVKKIKIVK
jgi:hypothetical protein